MRNLIEAVIIVVLLSLLAALGFTRNPCAEIEFSPAATQAEKQRCRSL